jgi:4-hydroxy-tetrahydrodipicolinate synthase
VWPCPDRRAVSTKSKEVSDAGLMKNQLGGVIAATPTPFRNDGSIDVAWVEGHLAFLRRHGCDGLLIAGTTGEGPSLSLADRRLLFDTVLAAKGALSVFAGCGTPNIEDTLEAAIYAHRRGADAVLILPPYYFRQASAAGLAEYYARLLTGLDPEMRVCLYNIPQVSGVEVSDELLDRLLERFPGRLYGIKDSSAVLERTLRYIERYPELRIWAGGDSLMSAVLPRGAHGIMSATACYAPDLLQEARKAIGAGREATTLQTRVNEAEPLTSLIDPRASVKYLVHLRAGLPETHVRPPLLDPTDEEKHALREGLSQLALGAEPAPANV